MRSSFLPPTLLTATAFFTLSKCAAPPTTTLIVDDSDSRIQYAGSWAKNPIPDPENFHYGGTLTATNVSGSTAAFTFSGAIQVEVFGTFPVPGTFRFVSSYSVDETNVTQYSPPTIINQAVYRQRFFMSNELTTGSHTLVITNRGVEFYLDYIQLLLPATPSATTSTPATTQAVPESTLPPPPSPKSSPPDLPTEPASSSSPDRQAKTAATQTTEASSEALLTSSQPIGSTSQSFGTTSVIGTSPPSTTASDVAPSTAPAQRSHSIAMSPGVYAGIGAGGLVFVALVIVGIVVWCRRRRGRKPVRVVTTDVNPFDPGPNSLMSPTSEKSHLSQRWNRASLAPQQAQIVPPYSVVDDMHTEELTSSTTGGYTTAHEALEEHPEVDIRTDFAQDQALPSPSVTSPLVFRRSIPGNAGSLSPLTSATLTPNRLVPSSKWRATHADVPEVTPRRSLDGGVRIAGGPLRERSVEFDEVRSAASTLPPVYQPYAST